MNRLVSTTHALRAHRRPALVAFLTAGYPDDAAFAELVLGAARAGADVIEVGIPFSDPIADGPAIQASSAASLARGTTLAGALDVVARLAAQVDAPLVAMSYLNPVLSMGATVFAQAAHRGGFSGVILPDVSFEESGGVRPAMQEGGLAYIDLLAPTSGDDRIRAIAPASQGFVYLVSMTGVTGSREAPVDGLAAWVARVRRHTDTPLYVGFGVSTPRRAAEIARIADGVIIGSRLVQLAGDGPPASAAVRVADFLASVRHELDGNAS